ncbi:MAG TPA: dihydroorotase [Phycisphaerae bacterium]|nr:dihydroorotase [Phycisphaerae bacterium]
MQTILLTNGILLDPSQQLQRAADLLIRDGKIADTGTGLRAHLGPNPSPDTLILDCSNLFIAPGLIDIHVHLREPGQEHKETIATGAAAAVAGGFTTICCMPNTTPALDDDTQIEFVYTRAREAALCRVLPIGAITKGRKGLELAEMALMHAAGAVGFSDDGVGVASAAVMLKALQYAKMLGGGAGALITQHCEEPSLSGGPPPAPMNAGPTAVKLGLAGLPPVAEELMIARDLLLNQRIGARYHVQHISTAGAVELVRNAKKSGQPVTAEVTPHHLLLTDDHCATYNGGYDSCTKMNPPLRSQTDVDACIAGVLDGTIDCLATDHAPHAREEKELEFDKAPFGILGLETALPLYARALVAPGRLSWLQLIEKMSTAPARVMGFPDRGTLRKGSPADITIFDPNAQWTVDPAAFLSKSRNTPFTGWNVTGRVRYTLVEGRLVFDGAIHHVRD